MIKTFTQNDLVRYIYQETTIEENHLIKQALLTNEKLNEEYFELLQSKATLDENQVEPPESCVNRIMEYAKTTHIKA